MDDEADDLMGSDNLLLCVVERTNYFFQCENLIRLDFVITMLDAVRNYYENKCYVISNSASISD
jgi:hypothetical protein